MATQGPIHDPEIVDPMIDPRTGEYAVIAPGHTFRSVTQKIAGIVVTSNTPLGWVFGLLVGACVLAISAFVWGVDIGHAGTVISAILLVFKQTWRNSINRFPEAMTIFAV